MLIFLSHATTDRAIAEALEELLRVLFGERQVRVEFSSDQRAGGGIPPGAEWLPWITDHITRADRTYVLLTPNSMMKPWVLWESGAAAGVALAADRPNPVVPVVFGISDTDVPSPLQAAQCVVGDSTDAGGVRRLLQDVNIALGEPLTARVFDSMTRECLPAYLDRVARALRDSSPMETLLATVPHLFSARALGGLWVTCYEFESGTGTACHADVVELTPQSDRRVHARDHGPAPRTQGHPTPFRDEIEAELANRHLIGHWKNVSDERYFGAIHLAVLPGENVMEGHYTSFASDVRVGSGPWKWVRLDMTTTVGSDLGSLPLRDPAHLHQLVWDHTTYAGPVALSSIVEGT